MNIITKQLRPEQIQLLDAKKIPFICNPVLDFKVEFDSKKAEKILTQKKVIWLFTSVRAVEALSDLLKSAESPKKIFTVGKNAAKALQKLGFKTDFIANQSEELLPFLKANANQKIRYFRGRHYRSSIPDFCVANEHDFQSLECYHSIKLPQKFTVEKPSSIWIFSPLSAEAVGNWQGISLETPVFSIGKVTSNYSKKLGFKNVIHPEIPSFKNLVELFLTHRFKK